MEAPDSTFFVILLLVGIGLVLVIWVAAGRNRYSTRSLYEFLKSHPPTLLGERDGTRTYRGYRYLATRKIADVQSQEEITVSLALRIAFTGDLLFSYWPHQVITLVKRGNTYSIRGTIEPKERFGTLGSLDERLVPLIWELFPER